MCLVFLFLSGKRPPNQNSALEGRTIQYWTQVRSSSSDKDCTAQGRFVAVGKSLKRLFAAKLGAERNHPTVQMGWEVFLSLGQLLMEGLLSVFLLSLPSLVQLQRFWSRWGPGCQPSSAQAQDLSLSMPHFHTGLCRIPLLWSFEPRSKTGSRNFLESFDLISCPVKRKAGVPISCLEAGEGGAFPHPCSREVTLQARLWGSALSSAPFQQCFSTSTHHFASLSKHLSLNMSFLCELDTQSMGKAFLVQSTRASCCYCCTLQTAENQRETLHLSCRDQLLAGTLKVNSV